MWHRDQQAEKDHAQGAFSSRAEKMCPNTPVLRIFWSLRAAVERLGSRVLNAKRKAPRKRRKSEGAGSRGQGDWSPSMSKKLSRHWRLAAKARLEQPEHRRGGRGGWRGTTASDETSEELQHDSEEASHFDSVLADRHRWSENNLQPVTFKHFFLSLCFSATGGHEDDSSLHIIFYSWKFSILNIMGCAKGTSVVHELLQFGVQVGKGNIYNIYNWTCCFIWSTKANI